MESIWKNKQEIQREDRWDDIQPAERTAVYRHESGLEGNREHSGNSPLYTACLMKI